MAVATHRSLADPPTIEQLRRTLERWRQINDGHHNEKRKATRRPYAAQPLVSLCTEGGAPVHFHAWARDISEFGICLLMPRELVSVASDDTAGERISVGGLVALGGELLVGLPTKATNDYLWVRGAVKRLRSFRTVAMECGVEFLDRVTPANDHGP